MRHLFLYISHVKCGVKTHTNGTHREVMPFTCHMWHVFIYVKSSHTYKWVLSHIWMSRVSHINESRRIHEPCTIRLTHINGSYQTYEWVVSPISVSHVTYTKYVRYDSHIFEGNCTIHIGIRHVTHINESFHTYKWVNVTHINESCHTYKRITSHARPMYDMTHTHKWVLSHIWMSRVSYVIKSRHLHEPCTIWLTHICRQLHNSHRNTSCHTYKWVLSHIGMSRVTSTNHVRYDSHT